MRTVSQTVSKNIRHRNDGFMKRLREKHPDLNNSECMMCAYLHINLTTKEIAPLLNISVRGVENHQIQTEKKMNLERDDSLTEYLHENLIAIRPPHTKSIDCLVRKNCLVTDEKQGYTNGILQWQQSRRQRYNQTIQPQLHPSEYQYRNRHPMMCEYG